jgi:uncharacterized SAM-binding protein YcdF (DUF218 family)
MRGRDILLQGRGADGVRAPAAVVRLVGATVAFSIVLAAESLGLITVLGLNAPMLRLSALVVGALLATTLAGGLLWWLLGALASLHMLVGFTPLVGPLLPYFVRHDPESATSVIVVLSGGMNDEGLLRAQSLDRILTGLRLVRERENAELALSVTHSVRKRRTVSTEADQRALASLLAPATVVHTVKNVFSTRDEAVEFAALARKHGWTRVTLVTSPMHSARACAAVEKAGLRVECRPAEPRDYALARLDLAENRRLIFADIVYETVAWTWYRFRGWV